MALSDWFRRTPQAAAAPVMEERAVVDRTPIGQPPGGAQAYISSYADTGRSITPEAAREAPTVYACTRLISQSVARMEWRVMRRQGGIPVPAREHPLYRLLNVEPNDYMGALVWRESMLLDCLLYGNSYSVIERDASGRVVGLHKLRADSVEVSRGADGMPVYTYNSARWDRRTSGEVYQGYDIFHLRAPSLDGLLGETPIYLVRNIIGVELEAEKFVASFFRNGARPAGIIKVAGTITEEALKRLRQSWQAITGGAENAGRVAILESGYQWESVSVNPEEAKLVELRSFCRSQIAAAFNVPVHMVGDATKTSYASAEQADAEFVKHCLSNWASRFEEECARKLVRSGEAIETHISFDALLRGDLSSRFAAYSTALNNGFLTINEVRERENYAPIDGGDVARAPVNLAIVDPNVGKSGDVSPITAPPPPAPTVAPAPATAPEARCMACEMEMLAAFDEATQGCISDKIPTLLDEGYPQQQAIAIAISMCSEGRSTRNCGTGEGGFQEGNDCGSGGGGDGGGSEKPSWKGSDGKIDYDKANKIAQSAKGPKDVKIPDKKHNYKLPRDPRRMDVDTFDAVMKDLGYEVEEVPSQGYGRDKQKAYVLTKDGKSEVVTGQAATHLIYQSSSDPADRKIKAPAPRKPKKPSKFIEGLKIPPPIKLSSDPKSKP